MALLRRNLLRELLRAPAAVALPEPPGAVLTRFRDDVEEIVESIDAWLDLTGRSIAVVVALVIMLKINATITAAAFLPLVAVVVVVNQAKGPLTVYRLRSREALGRSTGFLADLLGAASTIKTAGTAAHVVAHLRALNEDRRRAALRDDLFSTVMDSFNLNIVNLGTGVILLLAGRAMRAGAFTVGDFALFVTYLDSLTWFGDEIARWLVGYKQAGVSAARLAALVPGSPPASLGASPPAAATGDEVVVPLSAPNLVALEARGLTYCYPATGKGIMGVDLRVQRGEVVVVTGRVGAGKTTLLQALLGLVPLQGGTVTWNGVVVAEPRGFFTPPQAAYTPQVPRLFSGTLHDNILLGLPEDERTLHPAVYAAVLERDVASLENGLQTMVGPRGVKLSGGQVLRAAAARMFVRQPQVFFLDDLSSALDVETENTLWARLAALPDATVLAVSHRPVALRRADRIVVLADGRVEATGRLDALLDSCAEMRYLWYGQLAGDA